MSRPVGPRGGATRREPVAATGGRRQPTQRPAGHDRHAARRPPRCLRLPAPDEPAHRRVRPAGHGLRPGIHVLAKDARQLRRDADRPPRASRPATARRTRCCWTSTRRSPASSPTPATTRRPSSTTRTWPRRSATRRASRATARRGRRRASTTEVDRTRAITEDAIRHLGAAGRRTCRSSSGCTTSTRTRPTSRRAPYDTAFVDAAARAGRVLPPVEGFHGGVSQHWARARPHPRVVRRPVRRRDRLRDAEVGRVLDALEASAARDRTLVVITSDHGESLGEHDYYFDHGENLFDPCVRVPLLVAGPGSTAGRTGRARDDAGPRSRRCSTRSRSRTRPTSPGQSLLPATRGERRPDRARLVGQNDRNLMGAWDARFKIVATPLDRDDGTAFALYDRREDPGETRDAGRAQPEKAREQRRELELFRERADGAARAYAAPPRGPDGRGDAQPEGVRAAEGDGIRAAGLLVSAARGGRRAASPRQPTSPARSSPTRSRARAASGGRESSPCGRAR